MKLGVSESRLDGLDRHDLHSSGISFKLSFFFLNCPLKLRQIKVLDNRLERRSLEQTSTVKKIRENKEIQSGGLWFFHIST